MAMVINTPIARAYSVELASEDAVSRTLIVVSVPGTVVDVVRECLLHVDRVLGPEAKDQQVKYQIDSILEGIYGRPVNNGQFTEETELPKFEGETFKGWYKTETAPVYWTDENGNYRARVVSGEDQ